VTTTRTLTDAQVKDDILALMRTLAGDWEFDGELTPTTRMLADLGLESLDLVVLGTSIQRRYGRLPFAEFLAEIGERPVEQRDVSIGELVAFVCAHRAGVASPPTA
jgi:acyl carrier protein